MLILVRLYMGRTAFLLISGINTGFFPAAKPAESIFKKISSAGI
jgi:hypothetical protein